MRDFQVALENCELSDMGFKGPKFTWNNGPENQFFIKERLDRGVVNSNWCEIFPQAELVVEASTISDHAVLMVFLRGNKYFRRKEPRFRHEASWYAVKEYQETILCAWNCDIERNDRWAQVNQKLSNCQRGILEWRVTAGGSPQKQISSLRKKLNMVQGSEGIQAGEDAILLQKEINSLLDQEDMKWRQRAKADWLRLGDRNTKFFHDSATQRRKKNQILKIKDERGTTWETPEKIKVAFVDYFTNLFMAGDGRNMEPCLQHISKKVIDGMNNDLLQIFSSEEVTQALQQMGPLKAPGLDGFPAGFFQNHWEIMGGEITLLVLDILNSGVLPENLNLTYIALIPKIKMPTCVTEFRPISLCNVLYKLISKVLANRLKKVLSHLIAPTQSAFVPGRLITDNILAAYETLHTMHTRMKGKKGFMAIKLDMSKVYDRVEWDFLEETMRRMGFAPRWIQLIMMCVTTVKYSILVNGEPCGNIQPSRGLRQGDPIFPYLFLLCAEVLSSMVTQANSDGLLSGVPTSKYGPRVSHLFFADDSLLFCRASISQWNNLTNLLKVYEDASGQRLNNNKTAIYFSGNTTQIVKKEIMEVAGMPVNQRYDSYVGLPAMVGRSRIAAFKSIKDRVWKRLQDRKLQFLSQAGNEILLKAVIQAIPTYCMNVFLLPKSLCLEINSLMQKFWWGHQNKSKVYWMSWSRMSLAKADGGLGYRDFESFNKALLAKQGLRLWQQPNSFFSKIMAAKYYRGRCFLESNLGTRPSFAWRSIHSLCELIKEGLIWRIESGSQVRI